LQLDRARIAKFLSKRDFVPLEARWAHIDSEETIGAFPAIENAGRGFEREVALSALPGKQIGDAAHAIPAGTDLRTIIVVDANECVRAGCARGIDRHQLIV